MARFVALIVMAFALFLMSGPVPAQEKGKDSPKAEKPATELPAKERAAWEAKLKQVPADFLAVYVEASKIHVGRKSTAGYVFVRSNTPNDEVSLDCPPPPPEISTIIEKRLKDYKPGKGLSLPFGMWSSEGKNCSAREATKIWNDAIEKVKWKK